MPLEPGVDGEAAGRGVHARHILHILHFLQRLLGPVVPVGVVQMLSDERVRLNCTVRVHLGHVHVVDEVDEFLGARRTVVSPGLLLQRLLHHLLQHEGVGVVVEGNGGHQGLVFIQALQLVINEDGFAAPCVADEHDGSLVGHEEVHEVLEADRLHVVY